MEIYVKKNLWLLLNYSKSLNFGNLNLVIHSFKKTKLFLKTPLKLNPF